MESDELVNSLMTNKANLENVKPFEDVKPTEDLLTKAVAALEKNKSGKEGDDYDEW